MSRGMGTDNGNGERRQGLFYRNLFWSLVGGIAATAVTLLVIVAGSAYSSLERKIGHLEAGKLDKEVFLEAIKPMRDDIHEIKESIKAIWQSGRRPASRPHE